MQIVLCYDGSNEKDEFRFRIVERLFWEMCEDLEIGKINLLVEKINIEYISLCYLILQ